ncbi:MAG: HlyC/CorC family transporter [Sedimentisphaerales bacterium]|nr:HlyC/CorC family transporter [Sedimentisphaerales bacterium]
MLLSVVSLSLRYLSWVKLEEIFDSQGRSSRMEAMRNMCPTLVFSSALLRLLANLGLLICVVSYFTFRPDHTPNVWSLLWAFGVSAIVLAVFSVAIPRAWAKYAATPFVAACFPIFPFILVITWPVTTVLGLFDPLIRRLAGVSVEDANGSREEKQEELLNVVEEGEKKGVVDEQEREMIESVLEFREQTVGEIMTPRTDVIGIDADVDLASAAAVIISAGHSRFPVYEENIDKVIGMLYAKDLLRDLTQPDSAPGIRHRLRKAYFVPESKTLRDLLRDFQEQQIHLAVVLDEYGGTAGVVTIEDILEEIVGEIEDEYEEPKDQMIVRLDGDTIEMDARVHVDEINDEFDLEIPEDEDYETIGGFAFHRLGNIPQSGETFEYENLFFTVIDVEERKINRLRMVIKPKETEGNGRRKHDPNHGDQKATADGS